MKKVIVVSGASSGMGKEFIIQILEKEKDIDEVWAIARRDDRLIELKEKISDKIIPIKLDLTKEEDLLKYKEKVDKEKPNIIILANCAGFGVFDHSENIDTNIKLNMIDLNVKAPVALIDYSLPYMKEESKIMNIASCAGFQPIPYINDYASTKSFLLSYSRALNKELKYRNIHVLAVTPYWTKTEFFDRAIDDKKKKVVINYNAMYDPKDVMKLAIKDLYNPKKDISCFGFVNRFQKMLTKILPHSLVMKVWMNQQKLDGTPKIR
ncbi:MAG: SDR family NAD(P)-dependent oxidoreductase [Bacilli bacterium]|nr:SDR family NAD(P)-dependent oxidoreductase [Bacilli bacterium]MBR6950089.1 SDR family NAD(P)-dependent oxidoreductase [Bacilli bacterium]